MNARTLGAGAVLLVLVVAALGFFWPFGPARTLVLPGIVEIQEVRLGSKIGGRVARILVEEGQLVQPGDELLVLEAPELETQIAQAEARLAAAEAELERARNGAREEEKRAAKAAENAARARYERQVEGWRKEEKEMAGSELETARAELDLTKREFERVNSLYQSRSASKSELDIAQSARDRALGRFNSATAKVEMLKTGTRKEEIEEAKAEWDRLRARTEELYNGTRIEDLQLARARAEEMKARLAELKINLREATVRMPPELGKANVEIIGVRPGDLVQPNQPIIRVLRTEDLWVRIFVPETKLGQVPLGKKVDVRIDTFPDKHFQGVVKQRSSISEFTPRNVQSVDERRYQVFPVKIRIEDTQGVFNAGMAAEVIIPLEE